MDICQCNNSSNGLKHVLDIVEHNARLSFKTAVFNTVTGLGVKNYK